MKMVRKKGKIKKVADDHPIPGCMFTLNVKIVSTHFIAQK